jgi:hypothetical protein
MKIAIFIVMTVEQNFGETWNVSFVDLRFWILAFKNQAISTTYKYNHNVDKMLNKPNTVCGPVKRYLKSKFCTKSGFMLKKIIFISVLPYVCDFH